MRTAPGTMSEARTERVAITRPVSASIQRCELTHRAREPIDVERAEAQHWAYEQALERLGCRVHRLPPEPELPDAVFVEDAAVVLDELAIVTRPGAPPRRDEVATVAEALHAYRPVEVLEAPATLDGGDVLQIGPVLYVGSSRRSNREGHEALRALVEPHGYEVRSVPLNGCLHLKTAVTLARPDTVLLNPDWVSPACFADLEVIAVAPGEPFAANGLELGGTLLYPARFTATAERLVAHGIELERVELSELAKAEAGVTCCSLVLDSG